MVCDITDDVGANPEPTLRGSRGAERQTRASEQREKFLRGVQPKLEVVF